MPINDCYWYTLMARDFIGHHFTDINYPFGQRILVPYIASWLPLNNLDMSLKVISWASVNITAILLTSMWLRLKTSFSLIFMAIAWWIFHPAGVVFGFHYIANTDVLSYLFIALMIVIIINKDFKWLLLISPLATLERESFIASTLIIFGCEGLRYFIDKEKEIRPLFFCFGALLIAVVVNHVINQQLFPHFAYDIHKAAVLTVLYWGKQRLIHPIEMVQWIDASFVVLGGFTVLGCYIKYNNFKDITFITLVLSALSYFVFGLLGGFDMTRIIFDGFPFIATALFYSVTPGKLLSKKVIFIIFSLSVSAALISHFSGGFSEYNPDLKKVLVEMFLLLMANLIAVGTVKLMIKPVDDIVQ